MCQSCVSVCTDSHLTYVSTSPCWNLILPYKVNLQVCKHRKKDNSRVWLKKTMRLHLHKKKIWFLPQGNYRYSDKTPTHTYKLWNPSQAVHRSTHAWYDHRLVPVKKRSAYWSSHRHLLLVIHFLFNKTDLSYRQSPQIVTMLVSQDKLMYCSHTPSHHLVQYSNWMWVTVVVPVVLTWSTASSLQSHSQAAGALIMLHWGYKGDPSYCVQWV